VVHIDVMSGGRSMTLGIFVGIDWAEDHVRHEAREVERR